ncbi:MAG: hypothetical protein IPM42_16575 [Saprospiraceae bacterium]|nr:hypothetical protein [Saprospiraceae bacterium]
MENIEKQLKAVATKYKDLTVEQTILKEDNTRLNEVLESYKKENINLKKELEERLDVESSTVITKEILPDADTKRADESYKNESADQIKLELDNYISEIDQCIELIQSR